MSQNIAHNAMKQYAQVGAQSNVLGASPHRLIQMLMNGALEKMNLAKAALGRGQIGEKAQLITLSINIIDGLRLSLDLERGGAIAQNLDDLYDYMVRRLVHANAENNLDMIDEVASLLREIKNAWEAIPDQAKSAIPSPGADRLANVAG